MAFSDQHPATTRDHAIMRSCDHKMMVGSLGTVECSAKIAMPVLSDASATTLLLRDRNRMRRNYFRSRTARNLFIMN
jgi:hypothetical protein